MMDLSVAVFNVQVIAVGVFMGVIAAWIVSSLFVVMMRFSFRLAGKFVVRIKEKMALRKEG